MQVVYGEDIYYTGPLFDSLTSAQVPGQGSAMVRQAMEEAGEGGAINLGGQRHCSPLRYKTIMGTGGYTRLRICAARVFSQHRAERP